jgi:hypothetical protein
MLFAKKKITINNFVVARLIKQKKKKHKFPKLHYHFYFYWKGVGGFTIFRCVIFTHILLSWSSHFKSHYQAKTSHKISIFKWLAICAWHIFHLVDVGQLTWCNFIFHMVHSFQLSFVSLSYCESILL